MNVPHEPLLETSACSLDPASVFAAWTSRGLEYGLLKNLHSGHAISVSGLPNVDHHIRCGGPFFLVCRRAGGEWDLLRLEENKTRGLHTCLKVWHRRKAGVSRGEFMFLVQNEKTREFIELSPRKVRQCFQPLLVETREVVLEP